MVSLGVKVILKVMKALIAILSVRLLKSCENTTGSDDVIELIQSFLVPVLVILTWTLLLTSVNRSTSPKLYGDAGVAVIFEIGTREPLPVKVIFF